MKYKLILIILLGILLIGNVMALDSLGAGKTGENFTVVQICNDATYITLSTIQYPNRSLSYIGINMTFLGSGAFTYVIQNTLVGRYDLTGISDGCGGTFATYFDITQSGLSQSTSQGLASIGYLALMLILMFTFGVLGFKLFENKYLWIMGIFFVFLSALLLIYNTWLGSEYYATLTGLPQNPIPETIFYIFLLIVVLGLLVSLGMLFLHWKEVFKYFKREMKKKPESDDEDFDFDEWNGGKPYGD